MKARRSGSERISKRKLMLLFGVGGICLLALFAGIYWVGNSLESRETATAYGSLEGRFDDGPTIAYKGVQYAQNLQMESFLIMGIDKPESQTPLTVSYRNGGQCDLLLLLVINKEDKTIRRIQIDRDTMAEITVLGILGNPLGTNRLQICLAHGFGDGREQSCGFAVEAVQRLMLGIGIDGYIALNLDGITALNDLLGGVTVTLEEDFSHLDVEMSKGKTITLRGGQAETYVRGRMSVGDGTNAARMRRQQQYLDKAMDIISDRIRKSSGFIGTLFDGLSDYMLTDLSRGKMINEANRTASYENLGTLSIQGEHKIGESGFMEFHADEDALMQMVLDVFFHPVG